MCGAHARVRVRYVRLQGYERVVAPLLCECARVFENVFAARRLIYGVTYRDDTTVAVIYYVMVTRGIARDKIRSRVIIFVSVSYLLFVPYASPLRFGERSILYGYASRLRVANVVLVSKPAICRSFNAFAIRQRLNAAHTLNETSIAKLLKRALRLHRALRHGILTGTNVTRVILYAERTFYES